MRAGGAAGRGAATTAEALDQDTSGQESRVSPRVGLQLACCGAAAGLAPSLARRGSRQGLKPRGRVPAPAPLSSRPALEPPTPERGPSKAPREKKQSAPSPTRRLPVNPLLPRRALPSPLPSTGLVPPNPPPGRGSFGPARPATSTAGRRPGSTAGAAPLPWWPGPGCGSGQRLDPSPRRLGVS